MDWFWGKNDIWGISFLSVVKLKKIKEKESFPDKSQVGDAAHSEGHSNSNLFHDILETLQHISKGLSRI